MNLMGASEFSRVAVLVPFFGYLAAVFFIAWLSHRHLKNDRSFEDEYYVGSRSFGAWVLAMSWVATMASGGSFLGYPSRIFSYGWSMTLWVSGSCVAAIVGLGVIGKRINRLARQTGALTLVDILRDRFQSRAIGTIYPILIVFMRGWQLVLWAHAVCRCCQPAARRDDQVTWRDDRACARSCRKHLSVEGD